MRVKFKKVHNKDVLNKSKKRRFLRFDSIIEVLPNGFAVRSIFWSDTTNTLTDAVSIDTSLEVALINNVKKYYSKIKGELR